MIWLHGTFGREWPGITSADFDEVPGDGLIHPQLDLRSLSPAAVGALFVGGETGPPCPTDDNGGYAGQLSRLDIAQRLRKRVTPRDQAKPLMSLSANPFRIN
jgi:hypothetical protein